MRDGAAARLLAACVLGACLALAACTLWQRLSGTEEAPASKVRVVDLEVLTQEAATGDGGNAWGGHQCRIVRTQDGVFTAYTVPGTDDLHREWRLVWRKDGKWTLAAQGESGKDPVNLLAGPDGTLYVIGWPKGGGTLWSGKPKDGRLDMVEEMIPGVMVDNWPYAGAGIDETGNLVVFSSAGTEPGYFFWAYRPANSGEWLTQQTTLPHRHCYTYVFPSGRSLSLVSTRDVGWYVLAYQQPPDSFGYVFNAFRYWHTDDITQPLQEMAFVEEPPTERFPDVQCNGQFDSYVDTKGCLHVVYALKGERTNGVWQLRHILFSAEGRTLYDGILPAEAGAFCRIFQDSRERYYLLGSAGILYPMEDDGITLGQPITLNLGHQVEYSGFGIAVPRTGTPLADVMDVVFPTDGGKTWVYFRLVLK